MTRAYVGLGANLGDAASTVRQAMDLLGLPPVTQVVKRSSLYRSQPVDAAGPPFVNAVAVLDTELGPEDLLDELLSIEAGCGRERPYHHAPRTLDLDLLLYGDMQCKDARLILPHPRLHRRAFVLLPLLELAPKLEVPGLGALSQYLRKVADQRIERLP